MDIIRKILHRNGRIEKSVSIFDGRTLIGAYGSSIKEQKKIPATEMKVAETKKDRFQHDAEITAYFNIWSFMNHM